MAMYYYASRLSAVACQHRCTPAARTTSDECSKDQSATSSPKNAIRICIGSPHISSDNSTPLHVPMPETKSDLPLDLCYHEGYLLSGSLEALIELLIPSERYKPDKEFIFEFLLACRIFIRPHELLSKLCHKMATDRNKMAAAEQPTTHTSCRTSIFKSKLKKNSTKCKNVDSKLINKSDTPECSTSKQSETDLQMATFYSKMVENESKILEPKSRSERDLRRKNSFKLTDFYQSSSSRIYECSSKMADSNSSLNDYDFKMPDSNYKMTDSEAKMSALITILTEWTENFPYDFQDELVMAHVRSITTKCVNEPPYLRAKISTLLQNLLSKLTALEKYERSLTITIKISGDTDFLTLASNSKHLSEQLALIEYERLFYIGYEEYVIMNPQLLQPSLSRHNTLLHRMDNIGYENKKIWNLETFLDWLQRLTLIVANEICKLTSSSSRSAIIHLWLTTAQCCILTGNIITAAAILAALSTVPVQRLQESWSIMPSSLKQFNTLQRQLSSSEAVEEQFNYCRSISPTARSYTSTSHNSTTEKHNDLKKLHSKQTDSKISNPSSNPQACLTSTSQTDVKKTIHFFSGSRRTFQFQTTVEFVPIPILNDFLCDVVEKREECAQRLTNGHLDFVSFRDLAALVKGKGVVEGEWPGEGEWPAVPPIPDSRLAQYLLHCPITSLSDLLLTSIDREPPTVEEKKKYNII